MALDSCVSAALFCYFGPSAFMGPGGGDVRFLTNAPLVSRFLSQIGFDIYHRQFGDSIVID
jgi:Flp pilus assembly protein protease CpaA